MTLSKLTRGIVSRLPELGNNGQDCGGRELGRPVEVNFDHLRRIGHELLVALGEDPSREELARTPERFASWWREFLEFDPGNLDTSFQLHSSGQMIVLSNIETWSICEHHLLPFSCQIATGYIAKGEALGLSKLARVAHKHSHRLQIQERICSGIADELMHLTESPDVIVVTRGEHLCLTIRGAKTPCLMSSVVAHGIFEYDPKASMQFMALAGLSSTD